MAEPHTHTCTFFDDDGWLEPVCVCGQRALLLDEEGGGTLVLLDADDDAAVNALVGAARFTEGLAVSA